METTIVRATTSMRMMIQAALFAFFSPPCLPPACSPTVAVWILRSSPFPPNPHGRPLYKRRCSIGGFRVRLLRLGVEALLEDDAQLFPERLQLLQVLVVLALVLNLRLDACDAISTIPPSGAPSPPQQPRENA